jgi:hypothetical protein
MASTAPYQKPDDSKIPTVKVKRHWQEILLIEVILGIVVTVVGGVIIHWYIRRSDSIPSGERKPSASQSKSQAPTPNTIPTPTPLVILDVIPTHETRVQAHLSKNKQLQVHAGENIKIVCKPQWVSTVNDGNSRFEKLNLWVEDVVFNEGSTELHVAVSPWSGSTESAYLHDASGAYITDDHGFRYDVQRDLGEYREIKPDEIYRFALHFPKTRATDKLIFHHRQFQAITLWFPWAYLRPDPESGSSASESLPRPADSQDLECVATPYVVVLKDHSTVFYMRAEVNGAFVRFFVPGGHVDIDSNQIDHYANCSHK